MTEILNLSAVKTIFAGCTSILVFLFGGFDIALQSLLVFIVLDYITGLMKSYKSKKLNSKTGLKGIFKKMGILCMVAVGCVLDHLAGNTGLVRSMVIYYLVANEGLSIIENLAEMNIIIPEFLRDKLEQLKDKGDSNG